MIPLPEHIDHNRTHDLTITEVKECPLFRDLTDEQIVQVIDALKRFTEIIYADMNHTSQTHA